MNKENLIEYKTTVWGQAGLELVCYLEYVEAEGDGKNEPFYPESAELVYALKEGCDILPIICPSVKSLIERAFLRDLRK